VQRVHAVPAAILLHFNTLTVVNLVLLRDVVASLALLAGQRDLDALFVLCHGRLLREFGSLEIAAHSLDNLERSHEIQILEPQPIGQILMICALVSWSGQAWV